MPPEKRGGGGGGEPCLLTPLQNQIEATPPASVETPVWWRCIKTKWINKWIHSFCWIQQNAADLFWKTVMIQSSSNQQLFCLFFPHRITWWFIYPTEFVFLDSSFHIDTHLIFSRYEQSASVRVFLFIISLAVKLSFRTRVCLRAVTMETAAAATTPATAGFGKWRRQLPRDVPSALKGQTAGDSSAVPPGAAPLFQERWPDKTKGSVFILLLSLPFTVRRFVYLCESWQSKVSCAPGNWLQLATKLDKMDIKDFYFYFSFLIFLQYRPIQNFDRFVNLEI